MVIEMDRKSITDAHCQTKLKRCTSINDSIRQLRSNTHLITLTHHIDIYHAADAPPSLYPIECDDDYAPMYTDIIDDIEYQYYEFFEEG